MAPGSFEMPRIAEVGELRRSFPRCNCIETVKNVDAIVILLYLTINIFQINSYLGSVGTRK